VRRGADVVRYGLQGLIITLQLLPNAAPLTEQRQFCCCQVLAASNCCSSPCRHCVPGWRSSCSWCALWQGTSCLQPSVHGVNLQHRKEQSASHARQLRGPHVLMWCHRDVAPESCASAEAPYTVHETLVRASACHPAYLLHNGLRESCNVPHSSYRGKSNMLQSVITCSPWPCST
jgi:hypothetical protein